MAHSNGPKVTISLWIMTIVPFFFLLLRYYCKIRFHKIVGWDDYLMFLAWIFVVVYVVLIQISIEYGIGKHLADTDPTKLPTGVKYMYIGEEFALLAMPTAKTSFCITLLRLTTKRWHKGLIWFIIVTTNVFMWLVGFLTLLQCTPVHKLWDVDAPGHCWDNRKTVAWAIFVGSYSALMDFLLALCPYLIIHGLQMNKREKLGLIFAMSLGCLAGVACIVKTVYLPQIATYTDFTYGTADVLIWGLSETSITIVAASIPFLRLLVRNVKSSNGGSKSNSKNTYTLNERSKSGASKLKSRVDIYHKQLGARPDDDGSDKSILGESRVAAGTIMQTHEVRVEYGDVRPATSQGKNNDTFLKS